MVFTGIVTDVGTILSVKNKPDLRRFRVASRYAPRSLALGASVSHNGVCLTIVAKGARGKGSWFEVEAGRETLARTTAGGWAKGSRINLERALRTGDELGGHMVSGHIDGLGRLVMRKNVDNMAHLQFRAPKELMRFIAPKGSVALDGISLTVNEVSGSTFGVFIIPHTLQETHWSDLAEGTDVNLEVDLVARYLARLAEAR